MHECTNFQMLRQLVRFFSLLNKRLQVRLLVGTPIFIIEVKNKYTHVSRYWRMLSILFNP